MMERTRVLDQFRALLRSQAMIEFDMDGTIVTANENFLQAMGYALDEVIGRHHAIFLHPSERESASYQAFWTALHDGEHRTDEFRRVRKDGSDIWLHATYTPILDNSNRPYKVVKVAADITPQVVARRTLSAVLP